MKINNMRIGMRLGAGFGLVLLLLLGVMTLAMLGVSLLQRHLVEITSVNAPKATLAAEMRSTVLAEAVVVRNIVLFTDRAQIEPQVKRLDLLIGKYQRQEASLQKLFNSSVAAAAEKHLFQEIKEQDSAANSLFQTLKNLGLAHDRADANQLLTQNMRPVQAKRLDLLDRLVRFEGQLDTEAIAKAKHATVQGLRLMITLGIAAILLAIGVATWITVSITRPMKLALSVAQKVARGDLTDVIDVKTKDETGALLQALKDMNTALAAIVGDVRSGTDSISSACKDIASGNSDLSRRTEQQASNLEETASSMEEFTSTVKQNADNARQANQLAVGASQVAIKGGKVVGEVVNTMSSINESSKKIVDIIAVIDGIAFQTNILALNAAVEAARAGEQGRGFAVVASEVRSLAQRSAAAAKEIKALITDSVKKVEGGTRLVDEAGKTMDEIVTAVKRVTDIMAEIAEASREQGSGIEQVNQAIAQMDQATQQNAALVEEASAAAESLQEQAQRLSDAVTVFKLAHDRPSVAPAATVEKPARVLAGPMAPAAKSEPVPSEPAVPAAKKLANAKFGSADEWQEF